MSVGSDDILLLKNEPAPWAGYLVPQENYLEFAEIEIERDAFKTALTELPKYEEPTAAYAMGGFVLGIVTTVLIVISVR